jgi:lysozyme
MVREPSSANGRVELFVSYTDIVIDLSHHNCNVNLARAAQDGIAAVIHKSTQGVSYVDPMYRENLAQAKGANLLWGAYHFGTGEDGVAQAEFFLDTVQPADDTLLVLDFEANPQGASISIEDARAFLVHVYSETGRWPGIYGGYYLKQLLGSLLDPTFQNCWFWLSQYGPTAVVPPNWSSWTLWQYTNGAAGVQPKKVAGVGFCDRSFYCDTTEQLREKWSRGSLS